MKQQIYVLTAALTIALVAINAQGPNAATTSAATFVTDTTSTAPPAVVTSSSSAANSVITITLPAVTITALPRPSSTSSTTSTFITSTSAAVNASSTHALSNSTIKGNSSSSSSSSSSSFNNTSTSPSSHEVSIPLGPAHIVSIFFGVLVLLGVGVSVYRLSRKEEDKVTERKFETRLNEEEISNDNDDSLDLEEADAKPVSTAIMIC